MSLKLESRSAVRLTKSEALVLQLVADGLAGVIPMHSGDLPKGTLRDTLKKAGLNQ